MITAIALAIIIASSVFLIKCRNSFVVLKANVKRCKSQVNTARAKYQEVQKKAIGLAGIATQNEGTVYESLRAGKINAENLLSLGQSYPELKDKFQATAELLDKLSSDLMSAQTTLNNAVTEYNASIAMFPQNIAAYFLGYHPEKLIGEKILEKATDLTIEADPDMSKWV